MSHARSDIPRYTLADYEQWEGDWELWDGHPIAMSPAPNVRHQRIAGRMHVELAGQLAKQSKCNCEVLYEVDWRIKEDTVVRPDMVVVCDPIQTPWIESAPTLIVEVLSPSTKQNDRGYKRQLYAKHGVAYYLIVDPESEQVESLRLEGGDYVEVDPKRIRLDDDCSLVLDFKGLWS